MKILSKRSLPFLDMSILSTIKRSIKNDFQLNFFSDLYTLSHSYVNDISIQMEDLTIFHKAFEFVQ